MAEARKPQMESKQKGKGRQDISSKSKWAAEAKEKLETFTPLNTQKTNHDRPPKGKSPTWATGDELKFS